MSMSSVSRGLLRLARAAPRAVTMPKPTPITGAARSIRRASHLTTSSRSVKIPTRMRHLSTQSTSDGPGSTSEPDSVSTEKHEEDAAEMDLDPEATSDLDESSSDDSDDSDEVSDPELTSDLDDRSLVLEAAMLHVPSLGWTPAALEEGVRDEGLSLSVKELFPRGGGELVDYFETQCNSDLVDHLKQKVEEDNAKGSELLEEAMEQRLRMIIPFVNNWPQAMALKAYPANSSTALENLALMVDDVWYYAGDRSTDFNWYTKRALLATIYSSTEVFLVQDTSVDFKETWKFLHRRMEDANTFGKCSKEFQGLVSGGVETMTAGLNNALSALGQMSGRKW